MHPQKEWTNQINTHHVSLISSYLLYHVKNTFIVISKECLGKKSMLFSLNVQLFKWHRQQP